MRPQTRAAPRVPGGCTPPSLLDGHCECCRYRNRVPLTPYSQQLPPAFPPEHPFQWEFFLHLLFRTHSNCVLYSATITQAVHLRPPQVPGAMSWSV
ncbi:hypothetical protein E5288_WYG008490 [Bos mutus]|uniref:Uncharacterized protein n=1 Tax=Bos mutus TaxID=72004 RepID=A0A6B0RVC1_9CETA|nr:hypothetical protein [Bos mutus]